MALRGNFVLGMGSEIKNPPRRYTDKMTNDIIANDKTTNDKMTNGQNA